MDFLTKKAVTELQFYLNECRGNFGICFSQEVPVELLAKSSIEAFYYYQKQLPTQRLQQKFIQGELQELPFLTDSIDVFIVWHNLDFHEAPQTIVKEFWRALAPNGVLLIVGANHPCFFSNVKIVDRKELIVKRSWLYRALIHQGFDVEIEHTFGFSPPSSWPWLGRWLESIEVIGQFCTPMMGTNYLLRARKSVFRVNTPIATPVRKLPLPAAKGVVQPTRYNKY